MSIGLCLLSTSAAAGAPAGEPPARRANPIPSVDDRPEDLADRPRPSAAHAKTNVFFVNYDGVTLKYKDGKEDATQNMSQFKKWEGVYEPYGDGPKRAASLQAVKADWAKYDVVITDERPKDGQYTMAVATPTNLYGGGVLGVAPLDCMDKRASNIVFAFHSDGDWFSASTQATTISQEIAHAYGLEHVKEPDDIMNPYNAGDDPKFLDECIKLDDGGAQIYCDEQHEQFCEGDRQNSHAEVLWLFGEAAPDAAPPAVTITQPKDGETYLAGVDIDVIAEASDDGEIKEVRLSMNDAPMGPKATAPYLWPMKNFPAGTFCFVAEAEDLAANISKSAPVCVEVTVEDGEATTTSGGGATSSAETGEEPPAGDETGDAPAPPTSGEAPTSGEVPPGDGSTGGTGGVVPVPGAATSWAPQDDAADEGCSCATDSRPGRVGLLLLVAFAAVRRRRRG